MIETISRRFKSEYILFIILSIILVISLMLTFLNPKFIHQNNFNETYLRTDIINSDFSTQAKIADYIERTNQYIPQQAYNSFEIGEINKTQLQKIVESSGRAKEELNDNLYLSLQLTSSVVTYQKVYPFINCANNLSDIGKKYNPLFYYLSYFDKKRIGEIQYASNNAQSFISYIENYAEDNKTIINKAEGAYDINNRLGLDKLQCREFLIYLKEDYNRQKTWFYFKLLAIIIVAIIFYIIGEKVGMHDKNKVNKKSNRIMDKLKLAFSPEDIREETIKSIISISSVASTLVAFIAVAINISALNNWLVVGLIILSVISLLSSLLLGVIAVNNKDSTYRRWCYRMFMIGILLFVGFFLLFIFTGSLTSTIDGIGTSLQTYLNNQTIK